MSQRLLLTGAGSFERRDFYTAMEPVTGAIALQDTAFSKASDDLVMEPDQDVPISHEKTGFSYHTLFFVIIQHIVFY